MNSRSLRGFKLNSCATVDQLTIVKLGILIEGYWRSIGEQSKLVATILESRPCAQKKVGKLAQSKSQFAGRFDGPATRKYKRVID